MNREQALNYMRSSGWSEEQINTVTEAFTCEDAISRHAAIDCLDGDITLSDNSYMNAYIIKGYIQATINAIKNLPSVSTKKAGRWKKIKSGDKAFPEIIVCSRCGHENSYINEWNFNNEPLSKVFKTSRYCPNCGARMREVEE